MIGCELSNEFAVRAGPVMGNRVDYNSPLHRLIERFGEAGLPVRDPPRFNLPMR